MLKTFFNKFVKVYTSARTYGVDVQFCETIKKFLTQHKKKTTGFFNINFWDK